MILNETGDVIYRRNRLKHKLVDLVADGDENVARELRFLLKMETSESLKGAPLKRVF